MSELFSNDLAIFWCCWKLLIQFVNIGNFHLILPTIDNDNSGVVVTVPTLWSSPVVPPSLWPPQLQLLTSVSSLVLASSATSQYLLTCLILCQSQELIYPRTVISPALWSNTHWTLDLSQEKSLSMITTCLTPILQCQVIIQSRIVKIQVQVLKDYKILVISVAES